METFLRKKYKLIGTKKTKTTKETETFAVDFASKIKPGKVIGLIGNLGAGKTHFIKGIAKAFGIKKSEIISPTFGIVREHVYKNVLFYHFDFYRLKDIKELEVLGFREYLANEEAVIAIEWADKLKECFEYYDFVVKIEHLGGNKREIKMYKKQHKNEN
ncbi:MAG: tRNA (adenosine(37)-N6)-threonylcarbamoyltransferase complex ATPase subunit type 1 TsaE [bacterium]